MLNALNATIQNDSNARSLKNSGQAAINHWNTCKQHKTCLLHAAILKRTVDRTVIGFNCSLANRQRLQCQRLNINASDYCWALSSILTRSNAAYCDVVNSLVTWKSQLSPWSALYSVIKFNRNDIPPPVFGVPPPEVAVPPPKVVVPPPGCLYGPHCIFWSVDSQENH